VRSANGNFFRTSFSGPARWSDSVQRGVFVLSTLSSIALLIGGFYAPWIWILLFGFLAFLFWRAGVSIQEQYDALTVVQLKVEAVTDRREPVVGHTDLKLLVQNERGPGATFSGECVSLNGSPGSWVLAWGVKSEREAVIPPGQKRLVLVGHVRYGNKETGEEWVSLHLYEAGMHLITWSTGSEERINEATRLNSLPCRLIARISAHDIPSVFDDIEVEIGIDTAEPFFHIIRQTHHVGEAVS